jgi:N-acetylglucosamine kinase-like BadF-type ATPase
MMVDSLLVADVGGTHVRLRHVTRQGQILNELQEIGSGVGDGTIRSLMEELSAVVQRPGVVPTDILGGFHFVIASRGLSAGQDERDDIKQLAAFVKATRVTLVPDGVAAYVGCLGAEPGVVVTTGTGTIAVIVDYDGRARRLDGWGPQLGDVGSGYRVGLEGLKSACRWRDGSRGGSRMLRDEAVQAFGEIEVLAETLRPGSQLRSIARFAERVVAAARLGDVTAGRILDDAARELAELATDAAGLVTGDPTLPVVIGGGFVAAVPELAERLKTWFYENSDRVPVIEPGSTTLDGCQEIGIHGVPSPFATWVEEVW